MPDATQNLNLKIKADTSAAKGVLVSLKGTMTELNNVVQLGTVVMQQLTKAYDMLLGQGMAYIDQVNQISRVTGTTTEESSRLIGVLDDYQVDVQSLTMGMRTLRTQGIVPTVSSLAAMSDEYLKLNPGVERMNYLAEHFGSRVGQRFAYVMGLGSQAIRENSDALDENLIISQDAADMRAQQLLQLDELKDKMLGFSAQMATGFMSAIRAAKQLDAVLDFKNGRITEAEFKAIAAELGRTKIKLDQTGEGIDDLSAKTAKLTVEDYLLLAAQAEIANSPAMMQSYLAAAYALDAEGDKVLKLIEKYRTLLGLKSAGGGVNYGGSVGIGGPGYIPEGQTYPTGYVSPGPGGGQYMYTGDPARPWRKIGGAMGADIEAGQSMLVGEHGAERFTPGVGGRISAGNDPLVQEIRRMVKTLPVILRDAVAKA